ncbi:MAG: sugar phosphate isomerase/epimerase [Planctomycetales bacterium]|nr:sugar phosphate isomerase/epimerase [Planctomycetales bacterium]
MSVTTASECLSRKDGFKIGSCDWVLGRMNPSCFAVAEEIGLEGVQVSLGTAQNNMYLRQKDIQEHYLAESRKHGIGIASLAIGELNSFPYKSDPRTEQWVADSIDVCKALNVNIVLLAFFYDGDLRGDTQGIDEVVRRLKRVAPAAEKAGVTLGIESWLSAWEQMDIIQRVGSRAVKVYYDVGNSHGQGYDIYEEIRFLGEHICQFHAKDYDFLFGKGKVNFPAVRRAMDDIGYRSWILIEGACPLGIVESYRQNAVYLKKVFS